MSNVLATVTVEHKDEDAMSSLLGGLHLNCECHNYADTIRGRYVTKYELDLSEDCLKIILEQINVIHLTVTRYDLSPLGTKVVRQTEPLILT